MYIALVVNMCVFTYQKKILLQKQRVFKQDRNNQQKYKNNASFSTPNSIKICRFGRTSIFHLKNKAWNTLNFKDKIAKNNSIKTNKPNERSGAKHTRTNESHFHEATNFKRT